MCCVVSLSGLRRHRTWVDAAVIVVVSVVCLSRHLKDKSIAGKIQKLVQAGIVGFC